MSTECMLHCLIVAPLATLAWEIVRVFISHKFAKFLEKRKKKRKS